jgi:hypothetical protein
MPTGEGATDVPVRGNSRLPIRCADASLNFWKFFAERTNTNVTLEGHGKFPTRRSVRIEGGVGQETGHIINREGTRSSDSLVRALQASDADIKAVIADKGTLSGPVRDYLFKYGGTWRSEQRLVTVNILERQGTGFVIVDSWAEKPPPNLLLDPPIRGPSLPLPPTRGPLPPVPDSLPASYVGGDSGGE